MDSTQKANELVEKYLNTIIHFLYIDTEDGSCLGTVYMTHDSAVRCAIIAVDEIVSAIDFDWMEVQNLEQQHRYWNEVKEELKILKK